jgi:hypothetical protein
MSTSETINSLEKQGVVELKILFKNAQHPLCVQAIQQMGTGPAGNGATVTHQVVEPDVVQCLDTLKKRCEIALGMKTEIIQMPRGGRG